MSFAVPAGPTTAVFSLLQAELCPKGFSSGAFSAACSLWLKDGGRAGQQAHSTTQECRTIDSAGGDLCLAQVGITMVGASSLLGSGESSSSQAGGSSGVLLGMGLIVFAQARAQPPFRSCPPASTIEDAWRGLPGG